MIKEFVWIKMKCWRKHNTNKTLEPCSLTSAVHGRFFRFSPKPETHHDSPWLTSPADWWLVLCTDKFRKDRTPPRYSGSFNAIESHQHAPGRHFPTRVTDSFESMNHTTHNQDVLKKSLTQLWKNKNKNMFLVPSKHGIIFGVFAKPNSQKKIKKHTEIDPKRQKLRSPWFYKKNVPWFPMVSMCLSRLCCSWSIFSVALMLENQTCAKFDSQYSPKQEVLILATRQKVWKVFTALTVSFLVKGQLSSRPRYARVAFACAPICPPAVLLWPSQHSLVKPKI